MPSDRIRDLIEDFATKLQDVLKEDLKADLERALDSVGFGTARGHSTAAPHANGHRASKRATRTKGAKRDPAALEALSARFVDFVQKHPGLRVEQINQQLGTTTKDLALPIRKLLAEGRVKAHGHKRSTTYAISGGARRRKSKRN